MSKETISNGRSVEEYDFSFFFLFLQAQKRAGGVDLLGVELERVPTNAFKSAIDICDWSTTFACVHPLPWRSDNDSQQFFWRFDPASSAARLRFFPCRSHNESGSNPLPPIWKFFRLSAMCEILRWSLTWKKKKTKSRISEQQLTTRAWQTWP